MRFSQFSYFTLARGKERCLEAQYDSRDRKFGAGENRLTSTLSRSLPVEAKFLFYMVQESLKDSPKEDSRLPHFSCKEFRTNLKRR